MTNAKALTLRGIARAAIVGVMLTQAAVTPQAQSGIAVTLQPSTYQTVKTSPFNGQLAFYAPDLKASSGSMQLPVTVYILVGNGRRPFAVDAGSMRPQDFEAFRTRLGTEKAVRVIPFRITAKGEQLKFSYLNRSYTAVATDLIPCKGCPDRVVLSVKAG